MKDLRIAQIVPVNCLEVTKDNQYHMCLANLVKKSDVYASFYKRMVDEGKFVLMDNGAAENDQINNDDLIECYKKVNPTEIVLPDTLCDAKDTFWKSLHSYLSFKDAGILENRRVMFVPQGKTFDEWKDCAKTFLEVCPVDSIGISKFLEMETGDNNIRVEAANYIESIKDTYNEKLEIHLLGCSEGPKVIKECSKVSCVRGCDSAFAYICTQANIEIDNNTTRPVGEIDFLNGKWHDSLENNLKNFEKAIGVLDNSCTETWR